MNIFRFFHTIGSDPYAYAAQWKQKTGRKIIGHFCSYTPEEILLAAGALPFRIFGSSGVVSLADAHLQSYSCSLVRNALDDALAGRLDFLDGTVFPHTCDSIQRLSDIWRINMSFEIHLDLVLPAKLDTESARQYLFDVTAQFRQQLEKSLQVEITDAQLKDAIRLVNRVRSGLRRLYALKSMAPERIALVDIQAAANAAMMMDKSEFTAELALIIDKLETEKGAAEDHRKRIVLTGGICSVPNVFATIEECGAVVVADDLCTGSRYFSGNVLETEDPIAAIAQRYAERIVCPAKHAGLHRRGDHLMQIVKDSHAEGVIVLILKFCDPHGFDYPYLKQRLDAEKIPHLMLELEAQASANEQLRTRIEAFIESL